MRGFESRSRNEGRQRATAEIDGKALHINPLWLNRQSNALLRRGLEVRVLPGEREH